MTFLLKGFCFYDTMKLMKIDVKKTLKEIEENHGKPMQPWPMWGEEIKMLYKHGRGDKLPKEIRELDDKTLYIWKG